MYFFLIIFCAIALSIGFWLDNEIAAVGFRYWWLSIVVGYIVVFLSSPLAVLEKKWRSAIAVLIAVLILCIAVAWDDLLTLYLSGILLFLVILVVSHFSGKQFKKAAILLISVVGIGLIVLPISLNRIVLTLPNLSAGTNLSLHAERLDESILIKTFRNRGNEHSELPINFGTQIYFEESKKLPLLKIEIFRQDIVVRVVSIRYDVRVGFIKLPLKTIREDDLLQLTVAKDAPQVGMQMDRGMLLIDQLELGSPVWFELPSLDGVTLSMEDWAKIILVRLLFWLVICGALVAWRPDFLIKQEKAQ